MLLICIQKALTSEVVQSGEKALIIFFNNKTADDDLTQLPYQLTNNNNIYTANCDLNSALCDQFQPNMSLPLILFAKKGITFKYSQTANLPELQKFYDFLSQNVTIQFQDENNFTDLIAQENIKFSFLAKGNIDFFEQNLVKFHGKFPIGFIDSKRDELLAFSEGEIFTFDKEFTRENVEKFINKHSKPIFTKLNQANIERFLTDYSVLNVVFCADFSLNLSKKQAKSIRKTLVEQWNEDSEISTEYAFSYAESRKFQELCKIGGEAPSVIVLDERVQPSLKYVQGYENAEQMMNFLQQIIDGEVQGEKLFQGSGEGQKQRIVAEYQAGVKYGVCGVLGLILVFIYKKNGKKQVVGGGEGEGEGEVTVASEGEEEQAEEVAE